MLPTTKEKFAELYKKHSITELGKILECSNVTVITWANKLDLPKKKHKKLITDFETPKR